MYSILNNAQYGFRSGCSTIRATLCFLKYLCGNLDSGLAVFSLFLEFSKAFSIVEHQILLSELFHDSFRGPIHKWLKSYLTDRL